MAVIESTFDMRLANFDGDGDYRVQVKLYRGDWTTAGMGYVVANEVWVSTQTSPVVTLPLLMVPINATVRYTTPDFFSATPSFNVFRNGAYRARTTLQKNVGGTWTDVYTTPLSTSYSVLDVAPFTVFGDWDEVALVKELKIGNNLDFTISGTTPNPNQTVYTCSSAELILQDITGWYGNPGSGTIIITKGTWSGGVFVPGIIPPASMSNSPLNNPVNLTTAFSLANYSGTLKIEYQLPDDYCNGVYTPVSRVKYITVAPATISETYSARIINQTGCTPALTGPSKPICTTWNITTPMPTGSTFTAFKCSIGNTNGWEGAGSVGINNLTLIGNYNVDVYEVDASTGARLSPSIYLKNGTTPGTDDLSFNEAGYCAQFNASYPYSIDPAIPADGTGGGGSYSGYFSDYYAAAKLAGTLPAFSAKVFCADVSQVVGTCTVSKKSYFRIANAPLLPQGGLARMNNSGDPSEEEALYTTLAVFPNPTTDIITIPVTDEDIHVSAVLIDNLGKEVLSATDLKASEGVLHLEKLPAGIYFYTINKDGTKYNGKIIKVKN